MKRSWVGKNVLLILPLVLVGVFWSRGEWARRAHAQSEIPTNAARAPQQLSSVGHADLRSIVEAGKFSDLRWSDFSDYEKHVKKFYESYDYSLPWVSGMEPTARARQVIAVLLQAEQKGLSAEDYDGPRWQERLEILNPAAARRTEADALRFDLALTICLMRYVSDLHIGKVNPKHFDFSFDVQAKKYELPDFIKETIEAPDVNEVLNQLEPPYPGYRRTIQALNRYLEVAKEYSDKPLPTVQKTIAPGDVYGGVPELGQLLRLLGDLPTDARVPADGAVYEGPLVAAVKNFQRRFGRTPDGKITAQTFADLNVPLSKRVRQMQLTLERWRWLPVLPHDAPVVANIPEFRLRAYDEKFNVVLAMNVVVGTAYKHNTPVFVDKMEYVVFRPYWSVPYSIVKAEFLPQIARDPNYLTKKGFEVVDSRQHVAASGPVTNEVLAQLRAGKLFVRQMPGPKNSLGLVKFIFPNDFNIYMHDTPAQKFFAKSRRDYSHGCIRLEKPADLAVWALRGNPGWDMDHVRAAMDGTANRQVNLAHQIPVLIVYGTTVVTEDGLVHFYDDIYGHDAALEKVLTKGYPYPG